MAALHPRRPRLAELLRRYTPDALGVLLRYTPGVLGGLLFSIGVGFAWGFAAGLIAAGALLLLLDGRVR